MKDSYDQDLGSGVPAKYQSVVRQLPNSGSILDVGCHKGQFAAYLESLGYSVTGIEANARAAAVGRQRGLDIRVLDLENNLGREWPTEVFDVVLALDVLEHLREPEKVLARVARNMGPRSILLASGPNVAYWANRVALLRGQWEYRESGILDRTHLRFYTLQGWKTLMVSAGYDVALAEAAEGFIPLQHMIVRLPGLKNPVKALSRFCAKRWPSVFGCTVLLRCTVH